MFLECIYHLLLMKLSIASPFFSSMVIVSILLLKNVTLHHQVLRFFLKLNHVAVLDLVVVFETAYTLVFKYLVVLRIVDQSIS